MDSKSRFGSFRTTFGEAISALIFTAAVVLVVGGTTALCLERTIVFA